MSGRGFPQVGPDLAVWARQLTAFLGRNIGLKFRITGETSNENGVLLWDDVYQYPIISRNSEWRQLVLEGGHANLFKTSDVTASVINTAYKITYDTPSGNSKISLGSPTTRIVFEEAGEYIVTFSAQLFSSSASTVNFTFWPSINGTAVANSAIKSALHQNNATLAISRSQIFTVTAAQYLEINYSFDSTSASLNHSGASGSIPAIPATTLNISRIHG